MRFRKFSGTERLLEKKGMKGVLRFSVGNFLYRVSKKSVRDFLIVSLSSGIECPYA